MHDDFYLFRGKVRVAIANHGKNDHEPTSTGDASAWIMSTPTGRYFMSLGPGHPFREDFVQYMITVQMNLLHTRAQADALERKLYKDAGHH